MAIYYKGKRYIEETEPNAAQEVTEEEVEETNEEAPAQSIDANAQENVTMQALQQLITSLQTQVTELSAQVAKNTVTPDMLVNAAIMVDEGSPRDVGEVAGNQGIGTDCDFKAIEDLDLTGRR